MFFPLKKYTSIFLTNMPTIKAYSLQSHFHRIFCDALRPLKKSMRRQSIISAFVFACQFSFTYILWFDFLKLFLKIFLKIFFTEIFPEILSLLPFGTNPNN